jgi:hypothetical protein
MTLNAVFSEALVGRFDVRKSPPTTTARPPFVPSLHRVSSLHCAGLMMMMMMMMVLMMMMMSMRIGGGPRFIVDLLRARAAAHQRRAALAHIATSAVLLLPGKAGRAE